MQMEISMMENGKMISREGKGKIINRIEFF